MHIPLSSYADDQLSHNRQQSYTAEKQMVMAQMLPPPVSVSANPLIPQVSDFLHANQYHKRKQDGNEVSNPADTV